MSQGCENETRVSSLDHPGTMLSPGINLSVLLAFVAQILTLQASYCPLLNEGVGLHNF